MAVEVLIVGQLSTNCYLFYEKNSREGFILDPGDDGEYIKSKIKDLNLKPKGILLTHGHFDHVLAATELKLTFKIPLYLKAEERKILKRTRSTAKYFTGLEVDPPPKVDIFLKDKQKLKIGPSGGGGELKTIATPGHTPGSVSFYSQKEKLVFVGDLMFSAGGQGRTDLQSGDGEELKKSIKKILSLPQETIIYPGHGRATTIGEEKKFYRPKPQG
jgi:hydroxyacylglutathione hydrolase